MRIINATFAQNIGGVNQVFCDYFEALKKSGHEVALVISDNNKCSYDVACEHKIYRLKNLTPVFDLIHLFFIILRFSPDVIFCHSGRITKLTKILQKIFSFKTINVNHGTTIKYSFNCDYAISVNKEINESLLKKGYEKNRAFIVHNAIDIVQKYSQKSLNIPTKIAMFSRIEIAKGFDVFLRAVKILIDEGYDISLKIGGFEVENSGYGIKNIMSLAKELGIENKIDFVGLVKDKKLFFQDVDIFCVPSREETFGLPIIESFLNSVIAVSSDTDGGRLIIKDSINGFLFAREDDRELAKKIAKIIDNPKRYNEITKNAYEDLKERFSYQSLSGNLNNILDRIKL